MSTEYEYKTCPVCGIHYAVDKTVMDYKLKAGKTENRSWYCPSGHSLVYRDYEADRIQRELDNARQQIARAEDEMREQMERADAAELREKRLKKRAAAGTCPCCKHSFSNVSEHMRHNHPEFVEEQIGKVVPLKRKA